MLTGFFKPSSFDPYPNVQPCSLFRKSSELESLQIGDSSPCNFSFISLGFLCLVMCHTRVFGARIINYA